MLGVFGPGRHVLVSVDIHGKRFISRAIEPFGAVLAPTVHLETKAMVSLN